MIRRQLAALVLVLTAAASAFAGDEAPAPKSEASAGFNCRVMLANGRTVQGVVRVAGVWERQDPKQGWIVCAKDDPGASVRLSYVGGSEGSVVLAAKQITSAENQGPVAQADLDKRVADAAVAAKKLQEERDRARLARSARSAIDAATKERLAAEAVAAAKAAEEAATAQAEADLLAKFPPGEWSAERRETIGKRRLLLDINPTALEREFLANYDAWLRAAAAKAEADARKAARETPVPRK